MACNDMPALQYVCRCILDEGSFSALQERLSARKFVDGLAQSMPGFRRGCAVPGPVAGRALPGARGVVPAGAARARPGWAAWFPVPLPATARARTLNRLHCAAWR